jgi:tetratricopeptide (TPR) repeat protein
MLIAQFLTQSEGVVNSYLAQRALWLGEPTTALSLADHVWELAHVQRYESDIIEAARLQGTAALGLKDFTKADERLHHALTRARTVNHVQEELPALVALAELRRRQGNPQAARELLDEVWELAERGPYPLFHADALNVLAQIERDAGNHAAAIEAATQAYRLAWCDGPPFAYHWGLEAARKHLAELGAPEPPMPPFDESKYEPMPEVEIDPEDEFHVGSDASQGEATH